MISINQAGNNTENILEKDFKRLNQENSSLQDSV